MKKIAIALCALCAVGFGTAKADEISDKIATGDAVSVAMPKVSLQANEWAAMELAWGHTTLGGDVYGFDVDGSGDAVGLGLAVRLSERFTVNGGVAGDFDSSYAFRVGGRLSIPSAPSYADLK